MTDVLDKDSGVEPVKCSIAGKEYDLAYPAFAVTLYKLETAKLDRKRSAGRPKLTSTELQELKRQRREIMAKVDPEDNESWGLAFEESRDINRQIDEDRATGDSLWEVPNWWKIREDDPERVLLALWAGLHIQQADESWNAPISLGKLQGSVNFSNCAELIAKIQEL